MGDPRYVRLPAYWGEGGKGKGEGEGGGGETGTKPGCPYNLLIYLDHVDMLREIYSKKLFQSLKSKMCPRKWGKRKFGFLPN